MTQHFKCARLAGASLSSTWQWESKSAACFHNLIGMSRERRGERTRTITYFNTIQLKVAFQYTKLKWVIWPVILPILTQAQYNWKCNCNKENWNGSFDLKAVKQWLLVNACVFVSVCFVISTGNVDQNHVKYNCERDGYGCISDLVNQAHIKDIRAFI